MLSKSIALLVSALLFCASSAQAQEKLSVRLDFSPWGAHAAMHLAKEKGWFAAEGLDVDIQDGRGSGNTLQLVNARQVDIGQVQLGLVPSARSQGAQIKAVAAFERQTDLCILVDQDSQISKVSDLKGKSILVFAASPWAPFIDEYLKFGGLNRQSVEIMFVDAAALWGTYTAKRADGMMATVGAALPVAKKPRPSKCLMLTEAGLEFPSYGLIAHETTIAEKGPAIKKLIKVQQKAWAHLATNIDDGVSAIINQRADAKLDRDVLREQIKLTLDYFETAASKGKPIGWQADEDWQIALKSMERVGVLKPGWKSEQFYTNDFVP